MFGRTDQQTSTRSCPTTVGEGSEDSPSRSSPEDGDDQSDGGYCIGTPNASTRGLGLGPPSPVDREGPSAVRLQTAPMKPPQDDPAATMTGSRSFPDARRANRRQTMDISDLVDTHKLPVRGGSKDSIGMAGTLGAISYHPTRMVSYIPNPLRAEKDRVPPSGLTYNSFFLAVRKKMKLK